MDYQINRRKFAVGTSAFACSLLINRNHVCLGEERSLAEKRLILLGLNALARAPERSYFADGHRGAAMISAHLMCVNNQFDDAAAGRIVELFDLHWAPSALCKPFPQKRSGRGCNGKGWQSAYRRGWGLTGSWPRCNLCDACHQGVSQWVMSSGQKAVVRRFAST